MRYASVILSLTWLCCLLFGAATYTHAQRFPFYNLGIEQGLIQSQATALAQDRVGHLWVGTLGGLSRYDGYSFTNYSVSDGLPSNTIHVLQIDRHGVLWIGTDRGMATYNGSIFRQFVFQSAENPQGNVVNSIQFGADGTVWCIAGRKLYAIQEGKVQSVAYPGAGRNIIDLRTSGTSLHASIAKSPFLYTYNGTSWDSLALPTAGKLFSAGHMYEDRRQRLWMLTTGGIFIKDGRQIHPFIPRGTSGIKTEDAIAMAEAPDGSYWLGMRSGVLRMTDTSLRRYGKENGFTDNTIFSVFRDAENNIWMASDGQGLFRFSGAPFTALDESMKLPSAQIMALAAGSDGSLYLGTYDAGLYRYEQERVARIDFPNKILPTIISLTCDSNDYLWIGTRGEGLWRYRNGAFRQYQIKDGLPGTSITALYTDKAGYLWIGTTEGAVVYEQDSIRTLPVQDGVLDFLPLGDGSMVMATGNGLKRCQDGQVFPYLTVTIADNATPQCLALQGHNLWIGTSDNGVIVVDTGTGRTTLINKKAGLRSDFIYNLFAATDGRVWAGTGFGIYSMRLVNGRPDVSFYGRGQGVTGIESNHNAVLGLPDGSIWFGTTNGAMHYRPGMVQTHARPVSIVLQSVKLFGEQISNSSYYTTRTPYYGVPQNLKLPYRKNNLTFTFRAISLNDEVDVSYRYRMDGLDARWSEWAATNTVTYSALPPGAYTFQVQCRVPGSNALQSLNYPFTISTPFHKTGLFRLLVLAGCMLLGVSLQYAANKRRSARHAMIAALRREEQSKVRERTAEDFHDEVGNKITRINVLTNVLKSKLGNLSPDAERIIGQIQDNTGQLYSGTRDILWSLKPSNDNVYEIVHRIRDFGQDLFGDTEVTFEFSGSKESWQQYRLPLDMSRNLIMIFKEAMNNTLKYAAPHRVSFTAAMDVEQLLTLTLKDDGSGFDPATVKRGNGLTNMATRAARLNGKLEIHSATGQGTTLQFSFKIPQSRG
jgi:ligand-binding sensor domain-containing protein/signal transduction histidine kinase